MDVLAKSMSGQQLRCNGLEDKFEYTVKAVLTALLLLTSCRVDVKSGPPRFALTGPENWAIGGRQYSLQATYIMSRIDLPDSPLQFTVEYTCEQCAFARMTDDAAMKAALPIMTYAYKNGLYKRSHVTLNGAPTEPRLIGVVLVEPGTRGQKGYRIARSIGEIEALSRSRKL